MDTDRKILRVGAAAIACALVLRLLSGSGAAAVTRTLNGTEVGSVLLFLSTGRLVRQADIEEQSWKKPQPAEEAALPVSPQTEDKSPAVLGASAAELVQIKNVTDYDMDIQPLLEAPLDWDLTGEMPTVLILHTHGSESYTKTEIYEESSDYRTLDEGYNVVSVGERIAQVLEAAGIGVVHDRTLHDYPSYSGAYEQSRKSLQAYLAEYPSIRLVLDIHRDAAEDETGNQISYTVQTEKGTAAKLMLVVGSDAGGLYHPQWQENMALAVKLHARLEQIQSGICRPISLRTSRFNQDLCPGAVLVEVGAAGNTRQEALVAAEYLANGIIDMAYGCTYG